MSIGTAGFILGILGIFFDPFAIVSILAIVFSMFGFIHSEEDTPMKYLGAAGLTLGAIEILYKLFVLMPTIVRLM